MKHLLKKDGYSLIELLVVISIMLIMLGGGIATFISFNEKQTVLEATNQLKTYFTQAQSKARNGVITSCSDPLKGYRLRSVPFSDPALLVLQEICDNNSVEGFIANQEQLVIPPGATISPFNVMYKVLHGGVEGADSDINITVSRNSHSYSFKISRSGELSAGGWD